MLWQELFVSLKAANDQEAMAAAAAMARGLDAARAAYQPPSSLVPVLANPAPMRGPTTVNCTSIASGGVVPTVQTICK